MPSNTKFLVCGLGKSINQFDLETWKKLKRDYTLIAVNDFGRFLTPHFLVVLDYEEAFGRERYQYIFKSRAVKVFAPLYSSPLRLRRGAEQLKTIYLGDCIYLEEEMKRPELRRENGISGFFDYATDSPFMAAQIAFGLGAEEINLIGVDFTVGHFWEDEGKPHQLGTELELPRVNDSYALLRIALEERGVSIHNLSKTSQLKTIPFREL